VFIGFNLVIIVLIIELFIYLILLPRRLAGAIFDTFVVIVVVVYQLMLL